MKYGGEYPVFLTFGAMKVTIERQDTAYHLRTTTEEGQHVYADASPDIGGHNLAVRPMQMLLGALGSCSLIDVIFLLNKQRQPLAHVAVDLDGERATTEPKVFTKIHLHYRCYGALDDKKVERACRLSMEKMCSVSMMLKAAVDISWSYEILAAESL